MAVSMVARVREVLGVEAAIDDVFTYPVLADFAEVVKKAAPVRKAKKGIPGDFASGEFLCSSLGGIPLLDQRSADCQYLQRDSVRLIGQYPLNSDLDQLIRRR